MGNPKQPTLKFLGAAGTVTGSKYLISSESGQQLLLECGLFQGPKELRQRNWKPPPFSVKSLEAVVLSHAHIDHSGYLPLLARYGYRGPVYCTSATADLLTQLLPDAAYIQEEEAEYANRAGYSKHHPALPLYTQADAAAALSLIQVRSYNEPFTVFADLHATYQHAGHILGAGTVQLDFIGTHPCKLAFSGDLGRYDRPIIPDPAAIAHADILLLESTYGNRDHPGNIDAELARVINEAAQRGGALIVPAFAVGRTQELIWRLRVLEEQKLIPSLPVFIDSPMATNVTRIYCDHPEEHDLDMTTLQDEGKSPLRSAQLKFTRTAEESKALNNIKTPIIIISASGMATGGRVLHHLERRLPEARNTVLLVGFQAAGTRGQALRDGVKSLRMHGKEIPVKAHIESLDGLSAHADRGEILKWLQCFKQAPRQTYLVHGEPAAAAALAGTISETLHWKVRPAVDAETVSLGR